MLDQELGLKLPRNFFARVRKLIADKMRAKEVSRNDSPVKEESKPVRKRKL